MHFYNFYNLFYIYYYYIFIEKYFLKEMIRIINNTEMIKENCDLK